MSGRRGGSVGSTAEGSSGVGGLAAPPGGGAAALWGDMVPTGASDPDGTFEREITGPLLVLVLTLVALLVWVLAVGRVVLPLDDVAGAVLFTVLGDARGVLEPSGE